MVFETQNISRMALFEQIYTLSLFLTLVIICAPQNNVFLI